MLHDHASHYKRYVSTLSHDHFNLSSVQCPCWIVRFYDVLVYLMTAAIIVKLKCVGTAFNIQQSVSSIDLLNNVSSGKMQVSFHNESSFVNQTIITVVYELYIS